jgi:hypothetical protein
MDNMGMRLVIAVLVVAGLLALLVIVLRVFSSRLGLIAPAGGKSRLTIIETKFLDARHRVCLIGRDDETEHLVIIGANEPVVVETIRKKT